MAAIFETAMFSKRTALVACGERGNWCGETECRRESIIKDKRKILLRPQKKTGVMNSEID